MSQQVIQQSTASRFHEASIRNDSGSQSSWLASFLQRPNHYSSLNRNAPVLGSMNSMESRLARSRYEIAAAQSLRYDVFYKEMSAKSSAMAMLTRRDKDIFDKYCDHLLVLDKNGGNRRNVIATYRMLRGEIAERNGGFYSSKEFDLGPLLARYGHLDFLELGRSCILPAYRNKRTIELLWQGAWAYILQHDVDVLIGCASLQGTDPAKLALPLSFLHHHARAPKNWRVNAVNGRGTKIARLELPEIDTKKALRSLPPLIKGYLRLGAWVSEEAVVDPQFGTTDVLIILPISNIKQRYLNFYNGKSMAHKSGPDC
jgi:putative hemolysin